MRIVYLNYSGLQHLRWRRDVSTLKESFRKLFGVIKEYCCVSNTVNDVANQLTKDKCRIKVNFICIEVNFEVNFGNQHNIGNYKDDIHNDHCNQRTLSMF